MLDPNCSKPYKSAQSPKLRANLHLSSTRSQFLPKNIIIMDNIPLSTTEITSNEGCDKQIIYVTTTFQSINKIQIQTKYLSTLNLPSLHFLRKQGLHNMSNKYSKVNQCFILDPIASSQKKKLLINNFKEMVIWRKTTSIIKRYTSTNNSYRFYKFKEITEKMNRIFNYWKNYSKYYCNPLFLDFEVGKILKSYKEQKARIYYRTQYKKNSHTDSKKHIDSKGPGPGPYDESCEDNKSNKIIFNTLIKENIDHHTNILEELTLDENNNFLTYKIEFEIKRKSDHNLSVNFNNFSENSIISGLVSRLSTEEYCKNLLNAEECDKFLDKKLSSDKFSNVNLSTNYARELTENDYNKNTETNLKTLNTEESEKPKLNFTIGKYTAKFCSDKKKNQVESKLVNIKNMKPSEEKATLMNKMMGQKTTTNNVNNFSNNNNSNKKKEKIHFPQPDLQAISSVIRTIDKKSSSNVVATVPKKADENLIRCRRAGKCECDRLIEANESPTCVSHEPVTRKGPQPANTNNTKNQDLVVISPNNKIGKVVNPLYLSGINGGKQLFKGMTPRIYNDTNKNTLTTLTATINRNISKDNNFSDRLKDSLSSNKLTTSKNVKSNNTLTFVSTNKSDEFKKRNSDGKKLMNDCCNENDANKAKKSSKKKFNSINKTCNILLIII